MVRHPAVLKLLRDTLALMPSAPHWHQGRPDEGTFWAADGTTAATYTLCGAIVHAAGVSVPSRWIGNPLYMSAAADYMRLAVMETLPQTALDDRTMLQSFVVSWNDARGRTHEQVVTMLKAAIKLAEEWL